MQHVKHHERSGAQSHAHQACLVQYSAATTSLAALELDSPCVAAASGDQAPAAAPESGPQDQGQDPSEIGRGLVTEG